MKQFALRLYYATLFAVQPASLAFARGRGRRGGSSDFIGDFFVWVLLGGIVLWLLFKVLCALSAPARILSKWFRHKWWCIRPDRPSSYRRGSEVLVSSYDETNAKIDIFIGKVLGASDREHIFLVSYDVGGQTIVEEQKLTVSNQHHRYWELLRDPQLELKLNS